MITLRHFLLHVRTTTRLFRLLSLFLIISCTPKATEETTSDTTAIAADPVQTKPLETKPAAPLLDNGDWDGKLNYILDIPKGSVKEKNVVVIIAIDGDETSRHDVFKTYDSDGGHDPVFVIRQPVVAALLDTAIVYGEGLQQTELCFAVTTWYNVEFEDKFGVTYNGWVPDSDGVYSVYETEIGGQRYAFEGIQDSLWLGAMYPMELDLRFLNKDFDYAAADNCRDVTPLFFYSESKIYFVDGEIDDDWGHPAFNTSQTHLTIIGMADQLDVRRNPKSVKLTFKKDSKQRVAVVASRGRLKIDSVYNYRY